MNTVIRNIAAVIAGIIIGGVINFGIVVVGHSLHPPPAGIDPANLESYAASIHLLSWHHFIAPFAAHFIGTLAGALSAALIAASRHFMLAAIVGVFSLVGGIFACFLIPAPAWFMAADLILAYIPAAWIGWKLSRKP